MTEIYMGGRGSGKTLSMVKEASDTNCWIVFSMGPRHDAQCSNCCAKYIDIIDVDLLGEKCAHCGATMDLTKTERIILV